jgi:SpoVK/Ycf46/Vps4 family AAA+-type ATPase
MLTLRHRKTIGAKKMNGEILKRVVRAIASGRQEDLGRLASKIVEDERRNGHNRLADQLESILKQSTAQKNEQRPLEGGVDRALKELPLSKRHGEFLASIVPRESLEHHMVLPEKTESRLARIEYEFAARERLGAYGLRPRKTILLYGPAGCGKSLGAKRLAWNTGLPLMKVRIDALISSYFGESASNLRSVFVAAKQQPCVLLLDECDFIASSRVNTKDIGEASRIVNSLLQLMEEFDAPGLLVATTNLHQSLDPAIFRRFDEVLHIPPPGPEEIIRLLQTTLSAVQKDNSIDWQRLSELLEGHSAAMTVKAAQDAAKAALLGGRRAVTQINLEHAIDELDKTSGGTKEN